MRLKLKPELLPSTLALLLLSISLAPAAPRATHQKTVDGIIVNIGIVPAGKAVAFPGEAEKHGARQPSGAQHLVVSLSDAKTGARISGAEVSIEVKDPRGKVEKKTLTEATTAGVPDYSGMFTFGWSGKYAIKVIVKPKGSKRSVTARLSWTHAI